MASTVRLKKTNKLFIIYLNGNCFIFLQTTGKINEFRYLLSRAHSVLILTGAGISAESGVPTFRGNNGLWRQYRTTVRFEKYIFKLLFLK